MRSAVSSFAVIAAGIVMLGASVLVAAPSADGADIEKCIRLRDRIQADEKVLAKAEERVKAIQPRLDSINKQIDALTVKEADYFLMSGLVNPDLERQLTQLRTEYKQVDNSTKQDRDEITVAKRDIATAEEQMRAEGCPAQNTETNIAVTQKLDVSGMQGFGGKEKRFTVVGDVSSNFLLFDAPADYRWMRFWGTVYLLGSIPTQIDVACPVRTSSSGSTSSYDCNFDVLQFDDAKPRPNTVGAGSGRAHVSLTQRADRHGSAVLTLDRWAFKDTKIPPNETWHDSTKFNLQETPFHD